MKKIIALLIAVIMIFSLSVTAFAATDSPVAKPKFNITFINGIGAPKVDYTVEAETNKQFDADTQKGTFNSWTIFTKTGAVAKENVDYIIVSGALNQTPVKIQPLADLILCGNYNGKLTDPLTGGEKSPTSDKTGENVLYLVTVMTAFAGVAFVAKKQLAK